MPVPSLQILSSPYRLLYDPILQFIDELAAEDDASRITVVIPELVQTHWYEYLLHNHRALGLQAVLLFRGDPRLVVINVPWYLSNQEKNEGVVAP